MPSLRIFSGYATAMTASPEGRRLVERRFLALLRDRYPGIRFIPDDGEEGEGYIGRAYLVSRPEEEAQPSCHPLTTND